MTRKEILALYEGRRDERAEVASGLRRRQTGLAIARVVVFLSGVALAWFVFETDLVGWPWLAVPLVLFAFLMSWHASLRAAARRAQRAERFYLRGIARLSDEWAGHGAQGKAFADPKHPYSGDLDLFGEGSLFELLATTASPWGAARLAEWLLSPATPAVVKERQEAVAELAPKVELREALASEHDGFGDAVDPARLSKWAGAEPSLPAGGSRLAATVLGAATLLAGIGWAASWWSRLPFFALVLAAGAFAGTLRERVMRVLAGVQEPARELSVLSTLLERLESERFESSRLVVLQERLSSEGEAASSRIRRLQRLVDFLDARRNQLFAPFAAILLWGTQFAFALETWRRESGPSVDAWLDAVGELDALLALATYALEHPDDPFPDVRDGAPRFEAEGIGHPLIPEAKVVRNDVRFGEAPKLLVVSGSNMSGKSTFLRAVGINTVLALAGAPVRARSLTLSPFQVAASIRIVDSLQDGISHFYAEILRLRQVLELTSGEGTVLFLLDEILHGTNSHDRRIGADAVVRGLLDRGAVGLLTTHDLALSKLADSLEDGAVNVHFEDQIVDGKIRFDYVMREGVVRKSNALDLMRSVGLDV